MIQASFALKSSRGRKPRRFAYASATCIRMAMKISWNVTTHVLRNTPSIRSSSSTPTMTIGIVAKMTYQASRESGSRERLARDQPAEEADRQPHDVAEEIDDDREDRPELNDRRHRRARIAPAEELGDDLQMAGGGDGDELGEALDEAEDDGFEMDMARSRIES